MNCFLFFNKKIKRTMSDFKTKFFARLNELANKYKHQPTKYYIIRRFDDSDHDGIGDCIFTATNRYELWLKVHNYIISKDPTSDGLYLEDWIEEVRLDHKDDYSEESDEESDEESKITSNPKIVESEDEDDEESDEEESEDEESENEDSENEEESEEEDDDKEESEEDTPEVINATIESVLDNFEYGDTEWFEEFTKLI